MNEGQALHLVIHEFFFRIIEPLALRCAKFRFKPLSEDIMISRILHIVQEEGLNLDVEVLSTLSSISQGDLRWALTFLQSASRLFGSSISSKELISVSGEMEHKMLEVASLLSSGIAEGYPVSNAFTDDILDEQKARICKKLGEADKCLVDGADEYLQLFDVASSTM